MRPRENFRDAVEEAMSVPCHPDRACKNVILKAFPVPKVLKVFQTRLKVFQGVCEAFLNRS